MNFLEEKVIKEGIVINEEILKVDKFINHQVDPRLMKKIGEEFYNFFNKKEITKIITVESSGIAPALTTALEFDVPLVVLKKQKSSILNNDIYQTEVKSFTKNIVYNLTVSKSYILKDDKVLFIDDFLANGEASLGAIRLIESAGAEVAGVGILIEKSFQPGRAKLNSAGYEVYSLVRVKSLKNNKIEII